MGGNEGAPVKPHLPLTWAERFSIASDVARGLHFLHTDADPPIIHQDVKSDNILLGLDRRGQLIAKIADFGAVRIAPKLLTNTHVSTRDIVGTRPYQPPEYTGMGHVSEKTDAFAFGVVLLELLTGLPPANDVTNEFLYVELQPVLALITTKQSGSSAMLLGQSFTSSSYKSPLARLLPLLDKKAGDAKVSRALKKNVVSLALIATKCVQMFARERCTVRDVLLELDALAGRRVVRRAPRGKEYDPVTGKLVAAREQARGGGRAGRATITGAMGAGKRAMAGSDVVAFDAHSRFLEMAGNTNVAGMTTI